jgi:hypothetical protein
LPQRRVFRARAGVPVLGMVDLNGATLAHPEKLTDFIFKVVPG